MSSATDVRNMVNNSLVRESSPYGLRVVGTAHYNGAPCVLIKDFDGEEWVLPVYGRPAARREEEA